MEQEALWKIHHDSTNMVEMTTVFQDTDCFNEETEV